MAQEEKMTSEEYKAYRRLASAVLELVILDYRWTYYKYLKGQSTEYIYERQRQLIHDEVLEVFVTVVLNDTPDGLADKIERKVKEELQAHESIKKLRKH